MKAELFRQLAALGLDTEQIAGVLDIMDAEAEARREKGRQRWRKWKDNQPTNVSKRLPTTANVNSQLARVEDSSSKKEISEKKEKKEGRSQATRLPADWTIPEDWLQEAIDAGLTRAAALASASRMLNWSLSDTKGKKLDWRATWRNWFQRDLPKPFSTASPTKPKKITHATMWHDEARNFGILDDPANPTDRRVVESLPGGQNQGAGLARRYAGS